MPGPIPAPCPLDRLLSAARAAADTAGGVPVYAAAVVHVADGVPDAVIPVPAAWPASSAEDLSPAALAFAAAYYPGAAASAVVMVRYADRPDAVILAVAAGPTPAAKRRLGKLLAAARAGRRVSPTA